MLGKFIFYSFVSCIVNFNSMNLARMNMNGTNVVAKPERMCLNHKTAFTIYCFKNLPVAHSFNFGMIIKPVFIKPINKIIVAVKSLFNSKKYFELAVGTKEVVFFVEGLCFGQCCFVSTTIMIYAVKPVAFTGSRSVATKKVICYKNAGISSFEKRLYIVGAAVTTTGTSLICM